MNSVIICLFFSFDGVPFAVFTISFEIEMSLCDGDFLRGGVHLFEIVVHLQVKDASAPQAEEVGVPFRVAVKVRRLFVDAQHEGCIMFDKKFQCVVDGGLRQRGNFRGQIVIDGLDRRVGVVFHEIVHDGNPLERGLYPMSDQIFLCCLHTYTLLICNRYKFVN